MCGDQDNRARGIIEAHPQLINAIYEIQKKLGIPLPASIVEQQKKEKDVLEQQQKQLAPQPPVFQQSDPQSFPIQSHPPMGQPQHYRHRHYTPSTQPPPINQPPQLLAPPNMDIPPLNDDMGALDAMLHEADSNKRQRTSRFGNH